MVDLKEFMRKEEENFAKAAESVPSSLQLLAVVAVTLILIIELLMR